MQALLLWYLIIGSTERVSPAGCVMWMSGSPWRRGVLKLKLKQMKKDFIADHVITAFLFLKTRKCLRLALPNRWMRRISVVTGAILSARKSKWHTTFRPLLTASLKKDSA